MDNPKLQELLNIIETLQYFEKNKIPFYSNNPIIKMMADHLNNQDDTLLYNHMTEIVQSVARIESKELNQWLLNNKNFNKWLLPQDKLIFETNVKENETNLKNLFIDAVTEYQKAKSYNGYSIYYVSQNQYSSFKTSQNFLSDTSSDFLEKTFQNIPSTKRVSIINNLLIEMRSEKEIIDSVGTLTNKAIERNEISREEASMTFTAGIIKPDLLMPQKLVDKIFIFLNKGIPLNFEYVNNILGDTKKLHTDILKRDFNCGIKIMASDNTLDCSYFQDRSKLSNFSNNEIDKIIKVAQEIEDKRNILANREMISSILHSKENDGELPLKTQEFKI